MVGYALAAPLFVAKRIRDARGAAKEGESPSKFSIRSRRSSGDGCDKMWRTKRCLRTAVSNFCRDSIIIKGVEHGTPISTRPYLARASGRSTSRIGHSLSPGDSMPLPASGGRRLHESGVLRHRGQLFFTVGLCYLFKRWNLTELCDRASIPEIRKHAIGSEGAIPHRAVAPT